MPTYYEENPDGTRTFYIDQDAAEAAALLDYTGAPEVTEEQFEELTEELRQAREQTPPDEAPRQPPEQG